MTLAFIPALKRCLLCNSHALFDTGSIINVLILCWSMEVCHLMPVFVFFFFFFFRFSQKLLSNSRSIICVRTKELKVPHKRTTHNKRLWYMFHGFMRLPINTNDSRITEPSAEIYGSHKRLSILHSCHVLTNGGYKCCLHVKQVSTNTSVFMLSI